MNLIEVKFDAYRSLAGTSLRFDHRCCTLVGINESGKTNVLNALALLSKEYDLYSSDAPKIDRRNPCVRFIFDLTETETLDIREKIETEVQKFDDVWPKNLRAEYTVVLDDKTMSPRRNYAFVNLNSSAYLYLKSEYQNDEYPLWNGSEFKPASEFLIIEQELISTNESLVSFAKLSHELENEIEELADELDQLNEALESFQTSLQNLLDQKNEKDSDQIPQPESEMALDSDQKNSPSPPTTAEDEPNETSLKLHIKNHKKNIAKLESSITKKQEKLHFALEEAKNFTGWSELQALHSDVEHLSSHVLPAEISKLSELKQSLKSLCGTDSAHPEPTTYTTTPNGSDENIESEDTIQKKIAAQEKRIQEREITIAKSEKRIQSLELPVADRFSSNQLVLGEILGQKFGELLESYSPNVVWWERKRAGNDRYCANLIFNCF